MKWNENQKQQQQGVENLLEQHRFDLKFIAFQTHNEIQTCD